MFTDQLPGQLQDLITGIDAGDISVSVNNFITGLLIDLLPGATSLVAISDIPGEIAQKLAKVLTNDFPNVTLEARLGPVSIPFGSSQALADSAQSIVDAMDAADSQTALTDLLNIPAVLNGYDAGDLGISGGGLLSTFDVCGTSGVLEEAPAGDRPDPGWRRNARHAGR